MPKSKVLVITGASDGLGKALTDKLASNYTLVMLARNEKVLQETAKQTGADWFVCDVRDAGQVAKTFDNIASKHGRIDILINNAGVIINGDVVETSYTDITNVMTTNALGTIYVAKAALQYMKPQKSGLIVNVISTAGITAKPNRSIYNASKWALTGFTKAIQQEAGEYGVRVTGFYPGTIQTKLFEKAGLENRGPSMTTDQAVKAIEFILSYGDDVLIPELGITPTGM